MLTIPEPCNEDFSQMTPTERGAFCAKCQIDTFDFRDLSNHEINKVLLKHKNDHLCGQFTSSQLNQLNQDFLAWKNQKSRSFRSKFMLALIVVFGLSLFSCEEQEEKVILGLQTIAQKDRPVEKSLFYQEVDVTDLQSFDLLDYVEEEKLVEIDLPQPEIVLDECEITSSVHKESKLESTGGLPVVRNPVMLGAVASVTYTQYLEETVDLSVEDTIPRTIEQTNLGLFEAKAYPNPTKANATLELDIEKQAQFEIQLFDLSGKLIDAIHAGVLVEGQQRFDLELTHLPSGMYFVRVVSEAQTETIKVQRVN